MKSKILENGLSRRTCHCLLKADLAVEKGAITQALKAGKLYPYHWPPNYGISTHVEVCKWVGIDPKTLSSPPAGLDAEPVPDNGLSYRANQCLSRAGIPPTKLSVRNAVEKGLLSPGRCPSNYGPKTHAELCLWAGVITSG